MLGGMLQPTFAPSSPNPTALCSSRTLWTLRTLSEPSEPESPARVASAVPPSGALGALSRKPRAGGRRAAGSRRAGDAGHRGRVGLERVMSLRSFPLTGHPPGMTYAPMVIVAMLKAQPAHLLALRPLPQATLANLASLRRSCGKGPLPSSRGWPRRWRALCTLEAVGAHRSLRLEELQARRGALAQAMLQTRAVAGHVADLRAELAAVREEVSERHAARERARRRASEELLPTLEDVCSRLRSLRGHLAELRRRARLRTCWALDPGGQGAALLSFSGGHRLRLASARPTSDWQDGRPAKAAGAAVWLRFEPVPGPAACSEVYVGRAWLQALRGIGEGAVRGTVATVPCERLPLLVRLLDVGLLTAATGGGCRPRPSSAGPPPSTPPAAPRGLTSRMTPGPLARPGALGRRPRPSSAGSAGPKRPHPSGAQRERRD